MILIELELFFMIQQSAVGVWAAVPTVGDFVLGPEKLGMDLHLDLIHFVKAGCAVFTILTLFFIRAEAYLDSEVPGKQRDRGAEQSRSAAAVTDMEPKRQREHRMRWANSSRACVAMCVCDWCGCVEQIESNEDQQKAKRLSISKHKYLTRLTTTFHVCQRVPHHERSEIETRFAFGLALFSSARCGFWPALYQKSSQRMGWCFIVCHHVHLIDLDHFRLKPFGS